MGKQQTNLNKIYIWLVRNKFLRTKQELAHRVGIAHTTLSRILNGQVTPSEETLVKLNEAFDNRFNIEFLLGISDDMFPPQKEGAKSEDSAPSQTGTIIELYAQLIKEVEGIRRDLAEERTRSQELNRQLEGNLSRLDHLLSQTDYNPQSDSLPHVAENPADLSTT